MWFTVIPCTSWSSISTDNTVSHCNRILTVVFRDGHGCIMIKDKARNPSVY